MIDTPESDLLALLSCNSGRCRVAYPGRRCVFVANRPACIVQDAHPKRCNESICRRVYGVLSQRCSARSSMQSTGVSSRAACWSLIGYAAWLSESHTQPSPRLGGATAIEVGRTDAEAAWSYGEEWERYYCCELSGGRLWSVSGAGGRPAIAEAVRRKRQTPVSETETMKVLSNLSTAQRTGS